MGCAQANKKEEVSVSTDEEDEYTHADAASRSPGYDLELGYVSHSLSQ